MRRPAQILALSALCFLGCSSDDGGIPDTDMDGDDPVGGPDAGVEITDEEPPSTCRRVDLVFAVDDSSSMQEEKDAMRNDVFPGFAQALLDVGDGLEDFRVGVIDACPAPASFHTAGAAGTCDFESDRPWMDSTSSNLVGEFQCVGDILSADNQCSGSNDDEQPASAAAASLEPMMIGGGAPNEGFLRDDALLVVVAITDEDEQPTPAASAAEVYQRLSAVKQGGAEQMVFLGIGGSSECEGVYGTAKHATKLQELTAMYEADGHGLFWDLCGGNLEDGLSAALEVIESACEDFDPDACTNPDGCEPGGGDDGSFPVD